MPSFELNFYINAILHSLVVCIQVVNEVRVTNES